MESMGGFDDLEDALTEFNELINRRNWHQSVTTISLTDTDKDKCLAHKIDGQGAAEVWCGPLEQAELYHQQLQAEGLTMAPLERC